MKQATDLAGQPTDQGAYITGKAFIPFYFGGDRHRFEMAYKGWGRLVFAGGSLGNYTGGYLICVINAANESGLPLSARCALRAARTGRETKAGLPRMSTCRTDALIDVRLGRVDEASARSFLRGRM